MRNTHPQNFALRSFLFAALITLSSPLVAQYTMSDLVFDLQVDLDGDNVSTFGDKYAFNYWIESGGDVKQAFMNAEIRDSIIDLSSFFKSDQAKIATSICFNTQDGSQNTQSLTVERTNSILWTNSSTTKIVPNQLKSGPLINSNDSTAIVYSEYVYATEETSTGIRAYFSKITLSPSSFLRITSVKDAESTDMFQGDLINWDLSTPYFNGNAMLIELVASPGSIENDVELYAVLEELAGSNSESLLSINFPGFCDNVDNRQQSSDCKVGRLVVHPDCSTPACNACTAFLISNGGNHPSRLLSAGHCFGNHDESDSVIEFNVPLSDPITGALVHPSASNQYRVDYSSVQKNGPISGNDFAFFGCTPSTAHQYPSAGCSPLFTFATSAPTLNLNDTLSMTGYGNDTSESPNPNLNLNYAQQTSTGPYQGLVYVGIYPLINHDVDSAGGNSGSPTSKNGLAIGIEVGFCANNGNAHNQSTGWGNPDLQAALLHPKGISAFFKRGDANSDGSVDISDPIFIMNYLSGGGAPACMETADANDNAVVNSADSDYLLNWLFLGGPAPPTPGPSTCGYDPATSAFIGCGSYPPCN